MPAFASKTATAMLLLPAASALRLQISSQNDSVPEPVRQLKETVRRSSQGGGQGKKGNGKEAIDQMLRIASKRERKRLRQQAAAPSWRGTVQLMTNEKLHVDGTKLSWVDRDGMVSEKIVDVKTVGDLERALKGCLGAHEDFSNVTGVDIFKSMGDDKDPLDRDAMLEGEAEGTWFAMPKVAEPTAEEIAEAELKRAAKAWRAELARRGYFSRQQARAEAEAAEDSLDLLAPAAKRQHWKEAVENAEKKQQQQVKEQIWAEKEQQEEDGA